MGYEYSNRGPGGLSALEATIGADTCGWECDLADGVDGLGLVPTMQHSVMTAHTAVAAKAAAACRQAQLTAAQAKLEASERCATHTAEGIPIVQTAQAAAACAHARKMQAVAQMERARLCGR